MKLIFIAFFLFYTSLAKQLFILNYYSSTEGIYVIAKIGHPGDPVVLRANINSNIAFISNHYYNKSMSKSLEFFNNETIKIKDKNANAQMLKDTITFTNTNINTQIVKDFIFYLIENNRTFIGDSICLSYKPKNESFSITHILKKQGIIDNALFAIGKENIEEEGSLYFGNIPITIKKTLKNATCNVNKKQNHWACNIQYVYISDDKKDGFVINKSYFSSSRRYIRAPKMFYDYIYNKMFEYCEEEAMCFESYNNGIKRFECDCNITSKVKNINFVIDNSVFVFQREEMFNREIKQCVFFIDFTNEDNDGWVFGNGFYKDMYTVFDYEQSSITFYSRRQFDVINISDYLPIKGINTITLYLIKITIAFNIIIFIWMSIIKYIITKR